MRTKIFQYLTPRLQDVLLFCIGYLVIGMGHRMLNADGDLPRHILAGKLIVESGAIPPTEPFIYPYAGMTYISHEWLSDVVFYCIAHFLGLSGLVLLSAALLATAFTFIYSDLTRQLNTRLPAIFLVIWSLLATIPNWITRPHLISMVFLALWLILIDRLARDKATTPWIFPALMLVWCNIHSEFIAGILVLIAYTAGWAWDYLTQRETVRLDMGPKLGLVLILSTLVSFIQPGGVQSWVTIFSFLNNDYLTSIIIEAQAPDFQELTFSLLLGLLIFSIFVLTLKKASFPASQAFLLAGFSAMSLMAARNIHLYAVVAPFVLAKAITPSSDSSLIGKVETALRVIEAKARGIVWPLITIVILSFFIFGDKGQQKYEFDPVTYPIHAVEWLKSHPQQGTMFNDINWGGYIALQLWPQQKTFIDSIADYSGDVTKEYVKVMSLDDGWQEIFSKYDIDWVIIRPESKLAKRLKEDPQWIVLYQDETALILRR